MTDGNAYSLTKKIMTMTADALARPLAEEARRREPVRLGPVARCAAVSGQRGGGWGRDGRL